MSWIDITWPMMAAASLTVGLIHLLIWLRRKSHYEYLAFFVLAVSVAGFATGEWLLMRAAEPQWYGDVLRWMHVVIFTGEISIAAFVWLYMRAGRAWLFWAFCAARVAGTILNFLYGANINYLEVTALRHLPLWGGEVVSVPVGIVNPWESFDELISATLTFFLADASVSAWQRGDRDSRRRAAVVGGAFLVFFTVAAGQAALLHRGMIHFPYVVTFAFLVVVAVVGYELGADVLRAARLSGQLRESEQRMDLAADAAGLGLWEWDISANDLWTTERGRALFGFLPADRLDLGRFLERVHPDDRAAVRESLDRLLRGEGDYETEYRIVLPDGRLRWICSRGQVEFGAGDAPVLMRGVSWDVTARKQAEEQARRLESETAQQRDQLAHLSRVVTMGELSGALAHELNQPLAAILSNAQAAERLLARDPSRTETVREILADIVKSDKRASDVIQRLRALLKNEEPQHLPLDLNEVVQEVLVLMRGDLRNRGITCRTELAAALPPVSGDRIQLQQVLLNLIVNGCDAMTGQAGRGELMVRTRVIESGSVEVAVADRGCGIPSGDLERVFEPFVTTKPHGMGLGLAVCRTILDAHEGRLWAANNEGPGATVGFALRPAGAGA